MLTAHAEKIKYKYKILQFYQETFTYFFYLNVQGRFTITLLVEVQVIFVCIEQVIQNAEYIFENS